MNELFVYIDYTIAVMSIVSLSLLARHIEENERHVSDITLAWFYTTILSLGLSVCFLMLIVTGI